MSILQSIQSLNITQLQNIIGEMCSNNTETNITVTYDDTNGKLNFSVSADTNTFCSSASYDLAEKKATFTKNDNSTFELDLASFADSKADSSLANVQQANTVAQITTSDTVLSAFGKVMKWFTDKINNLGTASTKDVGTNANNVVALDSNSKLPAVDGSQLTNLASGGNWTTSGNNIYSSNSGNVGIGTSTPTAKLHISGLGSTPTGIRGYRASSLNVASSYDANYTGVHSASVYADGTIACSGWLMSLGALGSSDKKLKKNIKDIPIEDLDKLLKINIKQFSFKSDPNSETRYGFIAQQLEQAGLEMFIYNDDRVKYFKNEKDFKNWYKNNDYLGIKVELKKTAQKELYFIFNGKEYKVKEDAQKLEGVLKDGESSKIEEKQRDVEKTIYIAKWTQKAVDYNSFFVMQQALLKDVISVLKTQDLFFCIDDIKEVFKDKYSKTFEVVTKDGNIIKSIEENNNTQHKRIVAWLERSPDNQIIDKIYTKDEIIVIVKEKNNKKIRTFNDKVYSKTEWLQKSQNYQDIIARFTSQSIVKNNNGKITGREITQEQCDNAIKAIERKDKYVSYYHKVLKPYIQKTSIEELQNILNMNEEEFFNIKL